MDHILRLPNEKPRLTYTAGCLATGPGAQAESTAGCASSQRLNSKRRPWSGSFPVAVVEGALFGI